LGWSARSLTSDGWLPTSGWRETQHPDPVTEKREHSSAPAHNLELYPLTAKSSRISKAVRSTFQVLFRRDWFQSQACFCCDFLDLHHRREKTAR